MVKYWINDISGNIEEVFWKLGTTNVHLKRNKMTPLGLALTHTPPSSPRVITYNRGQKSLGHLCNVTDYLCFRTEAWRKRCYILYKRIAVPPPPQHNVENQLKLHVLVFNIVWGVGARLGRWSCIRAWRVRKSAISANLSQDFCQWLSEFQFRNKMSLFSG